MIDCLGKDDKQIGVTSVSDEGLLAVQPPAITSSYEFGPRIFEDVAPRLRLREAPRADFPSRRQIREIFPLLIRAATQQDVSCRQGFVGSEREGQRAVTGRDSFHDRQETFQRSAVTAIFLGDKSTQKSTVGGQGKKPLGKLLLVKLAEIRHKLAAAKLAYGLGKK